MIELLDKIGTLQAPVATGTTSQYSVSYPATVSNARIGIFPLNQTQLLGVLGSIPAETYQGYIDGKHTVVMGHLVVHNSITYKVLSIETHGPHLAPTFHKVMLQRMAST